MRFQGIFRAFAAAVLTGLAPPALADGAVELVMFDQIHCEWCARWDDEIGGIYPKTDEGEAAPLRRVDIHDDRPEDLSGIKGVVFTPTFVLVEDGAELGRIAGYPGADFFWPMLGKLLEKRAGAQD